MRSLTDIHVRTNHYGDDTHTEIVVGSVIYDATLDEHVADFGYPSTNQILAAAIQVAGIIARLALIAQRWIAYEAQQCGCPQNMIIDRWGYLAYEWTDICGISNPEEMLRPSRDFGAPPQFEICVPNASVDAWLERIRGWLETAITADKLRADDLIDQDVVDLIAHTFQDVS